MRLGFAITAWVVLAAAASADTVKIDVIPPDPSPPTTQPAGPTSQPTGFVMISNDPEVDRMIDRLKLSVEQFLKCQPAVKAYGQKVTALWAELARAGEAARKDVDLTKDTPQSRQAAEKLSAIQGEFATGQLKAREELVAVLRGGLDAAQSAELDETVEEWRGTPGGVARTRARQMLERMTHGVTLTDAQRAAAMKLLRELYVAHSAETKAAADRCKAIREQLDAARAGRGGNVVELELTLKKSLTDFDKIAIFDFPGKIVAARPRVLELLTIQQRDALGKALSEESLRLAESYVASRMARFEKVTWTDEQRAKVAGLAHAARNAMLALDPEDQPVRMELSRQLDRDVSALLTLEQRKQVRAAAPVIIRD